MSIWAKLTGNPAFPNDEKATPGTKYFYSSTAGQIISADGSGYVLPNLDKLPSEKEEFIPQKEALSKIKELISISESSQKQYQQNIDKLDAYYKNLLENSKSHYEDLIQDLKSKAKRHVEVQKTMKKQREDELLKELKQNEETIDEMRDSMANLNRKYQDEVRALKKQLFDTETQLDRRSTDQEKQDRYFNNKFVLSEMISKIESDHFQEIINNWDSKFENEKKKLRNQFENEIFSQRAQFDHWKSTQEKEKIVREECQSTLLRILVKLELEDLFETDEKRENLQLQVENLQSTKEELTNQTTTQRELLDKLNIFQDNLQTENVAKQEEIAQLLYDFALEKEQIMKQHKEEIAYHQLNFQKQLQVKQEAVNRLEVEKTMQHLVEALYVREGISMREHHEEALRRLRSDATLSSSQANQSLDEQQKEFETKCVMLNKQHQEELDKVKQELLKTKSGELSELEEIHSAKIQDISSGFESKMQELQTAYTAKLQVLDGKYERAEIELALEKVKGSVVENELQTRPEQHLPVAELIPVKTEVQAVGTMTDKVNCEEVAVNTTESLEPKQMIVDVVKVEAEKPVELVEKHDATVNTEFSGDIIVTQTAVTTDHDNQSTLLEEIQVLKTQLQDAKNQIVQLTESSNNAAAASNSLEVAPVGDSAHPNAPDDTSSISVSQVHPQLTAVLQEILEVEQALVQQKLDQSQCKQDIKDWTRDFQAANNRAPEVSDKALIRDKYQRYKDITTAVKTSEARLKELQQRKEEVEKLPVLAPQEKNNTESPTSQLSQMNVKAGPNTTNISETERASQPFMPTAQAIVAPKKEVRDQEIQVELAPSVIEVAAPILVPEPTKEEMKGPTIEEIQQQHVAEIELLKDQHQQVIEQLEDNIFALQEESKELKKQYETLISDKQFLESQLDTLIKEKRTDIISRYEEDLKNLKQKETELNEKLTLLTTEKVKNESKINELKDRSEKAEQELRDRDAHEMKALNPQEESYRLKGEVNKQRDQIILKAKAATAGWDAAANADEKLELGVERAYMRGIKEEKERHAKDLITVNASLEKKETRITELLVAMAEMEKKVKQSDIQQENMRSQMEAMKLEVADAIAGIQQMAAAGGGGGGNVINEDGEVVIPPSTAELERLREQLDTAQEEVVQFSERCERIEGELELARKRNRIYERLATMSGLTSGVAAPVGGGGNAAGKGDYSRYNLEDAVSNVKKAIIKGTNLWKSNRKDDCYDVYLDSCADVVNKVLTEELAKPMRDSIEHGKTQGVQNKQRGAVVFRKALDKFLSDAGQPNIKKAEEDAIAGGKSKIESSNASQNAANNTIVSSLMMQLTNMDNMFLEQGFTGEKNPANSSSAGTAERTPREGSGDGHNASSLLQRAKQAEIKVKSLQKQLAAVISASSASAAARQQQDSLQAADALTGEGAEVSSKVIRTGNNTGADPAEIRRLNRKIKDLETQIKNAAAAANSGSGGGDSKATQQIEKQLNKKIKDLEAQLKKETKVFEQRAVKAENALNKVETNQKMIAIERDQLKSENAKLFAITSEMNVLKEKAELYEEIAAKLTVKEQEYQLLSDQFKKETQLRKKYKNELEDLKGAIRVYARCRPMARYELEKGCKSVVDILSESNLKVTTGRGEKDFEFDCVFGPRSTQDEIFEDTKRLVESCLDGFNVCVFAYGQTGSGKTFTMTGSPSLPGLTPKAISELFSLMDERKHLQIKVSTYFVELYNDNLVDLYWVLDNKKTQGDAPPKLEIKMDSKKMVFIRNCVMKEVFSPYELMEFFEKGNAERHTGATMMNAESSRSHSIFAILVESYDTTTKRTTFGKLSLVDLAGSERADKTGAGAERLREAQSINKSLSALGDVIAALSEGGANKFIPYRNNKLTQLMQDSLGGNAKTLMFVNFSPADYNADETATSLMYAARVKKIVNNASKQAESGEVARLKAIIKRLQTGQPIADLEPQEPVVEDAEEPVAEEDDGKVYDGY